MGTVYLVEDPAGAYRNFWAFRSTCEPGSTSSRESVGSGISGQRTVYSVGSCKLAILTKCSFMILGAQGNKPQTGGSHRRESETKRHGQGINCGPRRGACKLLFAGQLPLANCSGKADHSAGPLLHVCRQQKEREPPKPGINIRRQAERGQVPLQLDLASDSRSNPRSRPATSDQQGSTTWTDMGPRQRERETREIDNDRPVPRLPSPAIEIAARFVPRRTLECPGLNALCPVQSQNKRSLSPYSRALLPATPCV